MKAAVMYEGGGLPVYTDMPAPVVSGEEEVLVRVKAVALKHFDKGRAEGRHYSSSSEVAPGGNSARGEGRVPGGDGVCILPDGRRVYAMGVSGMLAEEAVVESRRMVALPEGLDDLVAAALPNAVIGAAMGLRFKASVRPGDVVLVNGATGFTGRVAVQIAKYYGAGKVIATGRNEVSLEELRGLGADEVLRLSGDEGDFASRIRGIHAATPIDVVIDYLWGRTAEIIVGCLQGKGQFTNRIRYVSVGAMAGDMISLSAANLRSVDLQLSGSGLGAWTREQVGLLFKEILPEMFALAAEGKLVVKTMGVPLAEIDRLWNMEVKDGARLVVTI